MSLLLKIMILWSFSHDFKADCFRCLRAANLIRLMLTVKTANHEKFNLCVLKAKITYYSFPTYMYEHYHYINQ